MAYNFKREEEVKEFIQNLGIEYRFGCFHEKNPEVCHLLGDYLEAISKNFKKALTVYTNNCDKYNFPHSCYKTGVYYLQGKAVPHYDDEKAINYFEKGCKLGHSQACYRAGLMVMHGEERFRDYTQGLAYMDEACNKGVGDSCYDLSSFYIRGDEEKNVEKDRVKAAHYSSKACDLLNMYACANLSIMYERGDGVEKNDKLAKKYKAKADEMSDQEKRKEEIPFQLGLDP